MIIISKQDIQAALDDAATSFIDSVTPNLPPLSWRYADDTLGGKVDEVEYPDPEQTARLWADAFGLSGDPEAVAGTRRWIGRSGGLHIEVWYVSDREEFERRS